MAEPRSAAVHARSPAVAGALRRRCSGSACPAAPGVGALTVLLGIAGVTASACIYRVPSRPAWNTPLHAAAVQPHGRRARAAVRRGRRRRRRRAGWPSPPRRWPARSSSLLALRFLRLHRLRQPRAAGHGAAAVDDAARSRLVLRGAAARARRDRAAAACTGRSGRSLVASRCALALAGEMLGRYLFFVSVVPKHMAAPYLATARARPHDPEADCSDSTPAPSATPTASTRWRATSRRRRFPTTGCRPPAATARSAAACSSASRTARAVSVRGNPDHPVNRGMLCPKGLSEHHTIDADNRAQYPLLRTQRRAGARQLGRGARRRWRRSSATCRRATAPDAVGVISTGQLVTEEFYALGKLVQLGLGTRNYDGNTTLCMSTRGRRLQALVRQRRPARRLRGSRDAPTSSC